MGWGTRLGNKRCQTHQLDDSDALTGRVLVAEATHSVRTNNQLRRIFSKLFNLVTMVVVYPQRWTISVEIYFHLDSLERICYTNQCCNGDGDFTTSDALSWNIIPTWTVLSNQRLPPLNLPPPPVNIWLNIPFMLLRIGWSRYMSNKSRHFVSWEQICNLLVQFKGGHFSSKLA